MYQSLHCVALRNIKYNDRHSILSAYSLELGRLSLLIPTGNGKEAIRQRALVTPLSLFECESNIRNGQEIYQIKDIRLSTALPNIRTNPLKGTIAIFIADLLNTVLRESPHDEILFNFISNAIKRLDSTERGTANFHICFLYQLGHFIGIEPDIATYSDGSVFDMLDGTFRKSAPLHKNYLNPKQAKSVAAMSRMTFDNMHLFALNQQQRNELLDGMMNYYTIHYSSLSNLQSVEVLRMLFN